MTAETIEKIKRIRERQSDELREAKSALAKVCGGEVCPACGGIITAGEIEEHAARYSDERHGVINVMMG